MKGNKENQNIECKGIKRTVEMFDWPKRMNEWMTFGEINEC